MMKSFTSEETCRVFKLQFKLVISIRDPYFRKWKHAVIKLQDYLSVKQWRQRSVSMFSDILTIEKVKGTFFSTLITVYFPRVESFVHRKHKEC